MSSELPDRAAVAPAATLQSGRWSPFTLDSLTRVAVQAERSPVTDAWARGFRHLGQAEVYLTVVIGLFVCGRVLRRGKLVTAARRAATTLLIVGVVSTSIKFAVGRVRPGFALSAAVFRPFGGPSSFPSGHTDAAFGLAGSLALEVSPPVGAALLLAAAGTGWSRLNDNKHWLTDVLAGALLALVTAWQVRQLDRRRGAGAPLPPPVGE